MTVIHEKKETIQEKFKRIQNNWNKSNTIIVKNEKKIKKIKTPNRHSMITEKILQI